MTAFCAAFHFWMTTGGLSIGRLRRRRGKARGDSVVLVVDQDAVRRPFRILELAVAQRPEKGRETCQAQSHGNRDQEQQSVHLTARARRSELAMTTSELPDIAAAAISGVSKPAR